jgi:hypothetical protein
MWLMSRDEYEGLARDARELERDGFGPKVLLCPDGRIIKLFRIKRLLSQSLFYPYSLRFARNARKLNGMGIRSVVVERLFFCPAIRRHGVIYPMLAGEPLAKLLTSTLEDDSLLEELARFIAQLHDKRIYFRSLHLGNLLLLPEGGFGLIDVADLRFSLFPLSLAQRRRNFRHLFRLPAHRAIFERFGMKRFLDGYAEAAGIPQEKQGRLT